MQVDLGASGLVCVSDTEATSWGREQLGSAFTEEALSVHQTSPFCRLFDHCWLLTESF